MKYTTSLNEPRPSTWRLLAITIAVSAAAALLVVAVATMGGCSKTWNDPWPILKEEGNPCGTHWFSCGNGKCCPENHVCRAEGYCAFVGFGTSRDGGAESPQMTPAEVRESGGGR